MRPVAVGSPPEDDKGRIEFCIRVIEEMGLASHEDVYTSLMRALDQAATVDDAGHFQIRSLSTLPGALVLANGANTDIDIGDYSYLRITGPSAGFSVNGFLGGWGGRRVTIYNSTAQAMTVTNNATSAAANRLLTLTGADVVQSGVSSASFIYDADDDLWIMVGQS